MELSPVHVDQLTPSTPRIRVTPDGRMSRKDTAKFLDNAPKTLSNWHAKGLGPPCVKIGGRVYYYLEDVREWLQQQRNRVE